MEKFQDKLFMGSTLSDTQSHGFIICNDSNIYWFFYSRFTLIQIYLISTELSNARLLKLNTIDSLSWIVVLGFPDGSDSKKKKKKSVCNAGDLSLIPGLGWSPGEGNGYPRQYFCLQNPMDRGAWWSTVHGVAKSWTWWKQLSTTHDTFFVVRGRPVHCRMWTHGVYLRNTNSTSSHFGVTTKMISWHYQIFLRRPSHPGLRTTVLVGKLKLSEPAAKSFWHHSSPTCRDRHVPLGMEPVLQ